jgi:hypothetical protein
MFSSFTKQGILIALNLGMHLCLHDPVYYAELGFGQQ